MCLDLFISRKELNLHKKVNHGWSKNKTVMSNDNDKHKCDFKGCGKEFDSLSKLNRHKQFHLMLYQCDVCLKKFGRKWDLNIHKRIHLNVKSEQCCYCKKRFCDPSSKLRHIQTIHLKNKTCVCLKCNKTFTQFSILQ